MELPTAVKIVFLLAGAAHAAHAGRSLVGLPWLVELSPRAVCTAPAEIICSIDCTEVQLCLGDGSGGFNPSVIATCEAGTVCSAEQAACVAEGQSECQPPAAFTCHDIGSFPDPYDCQKYHICSQVGLGSISVSCPGTSAYNPMRADCSLTTADRVCVEGPITPCARLGDMGVVPENPAIYYICMQKDGHLVPEMYRCPGNQVFDTAAAACVEPTMESPTNTTD